MKLNRTHVLSLILTSGMMCSQVSVADRYIYGTPGNDILLRSDSDTVGIFGLQGNDYIRMTPYANQMLLDGGEGNDTIVVSNDERNDLRGGHGDDHIYGGSGSEDIKGGFGDDFIRGYDGEDTIQGNQGNDEIWGGRGYDDLDGNSGNDFIYGEQDSDFMYGGTGVDWMDGGFGWDYMEGERGNDTLIGGPANDYGTDEAYGGDGIDTCRETETNISCEL